MEDSNTTVLPPTTKNLTISSQTDNEIVPWSKGSYRAEIPKYWEREEINRLLDNVTNHKHKMLLQFLWLSGVRVTEAVSLRKKDIDFKNHVMRVKWLKSRKYLERVVPIHPILKQILEVYTAPMNMEHHVFPYSRQNAWHICNKWMQGGPHKFRHSFAVNWLRQEGDLVVLHRILGHSKIQTTMEYLKIVPLDQGKELMKMRFD